jgi:hypothetical protein
MNNITRGAQKSPPNTSLSTRQKDQTMARQNKMPRTFSGMRDALFDEIDAMRSGNGDLERVRAVVQLTGRVNDAVHAEVKARKLLGESAGDPAGMRSLLS